MPPITPVKAVKGYPVLIHVYDVSTTDTIRNLNSMTQAVGGGVFHTGVEVMDREYYFGYRAGGGSGVLGIAPRSCKEHVYRQSIKMGVCDLSKEEIDKILRVFGKLWQGDEYDLLRRNCCSFANELCAALGVGSMPAWVDRFGALIVSRNFDKMRALPPLSPALRPRPTPP